MLTSDEDGKHIKEMKWGIHRVVGPKLEKDIINTRADKALSRFWAKNVRNYRCLVPATGFYEWKIVDGSKTPFFIHPRDRKVFSFAGVYSTDSEGNQSYSIMTTEPNNEMASIHNRMPVILPKEHEGSWLTAESDDDIMSLLLPYPDGGLDMYEISKAVNSPRNNYPELLQPAT